MAPVRLPNCAVEAKYVWEMQPGDRAGVDPAAIVAPGKRPFVVARAALRHEGAGKVTIIKQEDGYYIDLSHVPDVRFGREMGRYRVYRVKGVSGAC